MQAQTSQWMEATWPWDQKDMGSSLCLLGVTTSCCTVLVLPSACMISLIYSLSSVVQEIYHVTRAPEASHVRA